MNSRCFGKSSLLWLRTLLPGLRFGSRTKL
uniref:Uncharacterized protein n=1 Tax=Salmonella phage PMBT18 TaxID=3229742 RepID=A0AB39C098_9CAUD